MRIPANHGYHRLRKGRISLARQIYLLTSVCAHRDPRFADSGVATAVVHTLAEPRLWRDAQPLCWVLMPDHFHLILRLGDSEPLPRLMNRLKSVTARTARAMDGNPNAVWMAGYHDHALRAEAQLHEVIRYVLENPLRAGLVKSVEDYPYRYCRWQLDALPP